MRCPVALVSIIFLGEVRVEVLNEQPVADLAERTMAVMYCMQ